MSAKQGEASESYRVLVVEDDQASRLLLKRRLEKAGYPVAVCSTGREAVSVLTEIGADIVISDWCIPDLSGLELCRAVNELRDSNALGSIYFILLTALVEQERVVEAFEAGADDFLRKPYEFAELLARIRAGERILNLQRELQERQVELSRYTAQLAGLNRRLERLANTDMLTGLPNRRQVLERLAEAWAMAERRNQPLSCVMFDVDHFKRINDTYGHTAGDVVLKEVARIARSMIRKYDMCGRIGGEEFLIVCPEEPIEGAARVAERVRGAVAGKAVFYEGASILVTISLGVASKRPEHLNPEALISVADAMLYAAKEHGRNQVWYGSTRLEAKCYTAAPLPVVGRR